MLGFRVQGLGLAFIGVWGFSVVKKCDQEIGFGSSKFSMAQKYNEEI